MHFNSFLSIFLVFADSGCCIGGFFARHSVENGTLSKKTYDHNLFEYAQFPTSIFSSYYIPPTATQEPQPAIYDEVLGLQFPLSLTDPSTVDSNNEYIPISYPLPWNNVTITHKDAYVTKVVKQAQSIIEGYRKNRKSNMCSTCVALLEVAQTLARDLPQHFPAGAQALCKAVKYTSDANCMTQFQPNATISLIQILQLADLKTEDAQWLCNRMWLPHSFCPAPTLATQSTQNLIPKSKPLNAKAPPPSGEKVKVAHLSDIHIDPRYSAGASVSRRCRLGNPPSEKVSDPAPLYGSYYCDAPYYLVASALSSVGPLTGTGSDLNSTLAWTIYTGDLVPHESNAHITADYMSYIETSAYHLLQNMLPSGPIYAVLGNHDQGHEAFLANNGRPGTFGAQQAQNYEHVTKLWENAGWLDSTAATDSRTHYTAYATTHPSYSKLRIIALNTDMWYIQNPFNYAQSANPDYSGLFTFLVTELQAAEDTGQRVWIIGHVPPGWDGTQAMPGQSDLFYQIVARYSPHIIAEIFFGHTHNDQVTVYYDYKDINNGRGPVEDSATALATAWIGPSIVPFQDLNSAWRMYEVDTGDFHVYESYTFFTDVSEFPALDKQYRERKSPQVSVGGPAWQLEYSARAAYGSAIAWPQDAPLNATFWHRVTEVMEKNATLVAEFNRRKTRGVGMGCGTNAACVRQTVCRIRSGSVALGLRCG